MTTFFTIVIAVIFAAAYSIGTIIYGVAFGHDEDSIFTPFKILFFGWLIVWYEDIKTMLEELKD